MLQSLTEGAYYAVPFPSSGDVVMRRPSAYSDSNQVGQGRFRSSSLRSTLRFKRNSRTWSLHRAQTRQVSEQVRL